MIYATFVITKSLWIGTVVRRVRSFRSRSEYNSTVVGKFESFALAALRTAHSTHETNVMLVYFSFQVITILVLAISLCFAILVERV